MNRFLALLLTFSLGCQALPPDDQSLQGSNNYESLMDNDGDGQSPSAGDCDDSNPYIYTGAPEFCDTFDNDCDDLVDDEDPTSVGLVWMYDGDVDDYGRESEDGDAQYVTACDIDTFEELVENVGGDAEMLAFYVPAQYDSAGNIFVDCDDGNAARNPGQPEVCDGIDNDCDDVVDNGVPTPVTFYGDGDGDGWGDPLDEAIACEAPTGFVSNDDDCNDDDPAINPAATEVCDSTDTDEDCDTVADDADSSADPSTMTDWFVDEDDDGWGDPPPAATACDDPTSGNLVDNGLDCDDSNAASYPGAFEICDAQDNDCDSVVPAGETDDDVDGQAECEGDCNDGDAAINTAAIEVCDPADVDEDCDSVADDADTSTSPASMSTFFQDADVDTFGNPSMSLLACSAPSGYVSDSTDCDDGNVSTYPGAPESCDLVDNDCDGTADDGVESPFNQDADGDTYGNPAVIVMACVAPSGYVSNDDDCNDGDATAFPGAPEYCDDVDDDCDGDVDESAVDRTTWFRDFDSDTYGNSAISVMSCDAPVGFIDSAGDCNDFDASVNPAALEVFNGEDDDCDGSVDEGLSCAIEILIFDGGGQATSLTGDVSDNAALSGEWYPAGVSGVSVVPTSLGGDDWEYDIAFDQCLSASGTIVVDGTFENGESICDDPIATLYGWMDETELDSATFVNADSTCAVELFLP